MYLYYECYEDEDDGVFSRLSLRAPPSPNLDPISAGLRAAAAAMPHVAATSDGNDIIMRTLRSAALAAGRL